MLNDITVFNIREYLSDKDDKILGEEVLQQILSEFSCEKNSDVEKFLKGKSIEFTKKNQSVTYLVFSNEDAALVGARLLMLEQNYKPLDEDDFRHIEFQKNGVLFELHRAFLPHVSAIGKRTRPVGTH